jgi:hypothetical protein
VPAVARACAWRSAHHRSTAERTRVEMLVMRTFGLMHRLNGYVFGLFELRELNVRQLEYRRGCEAHDHSRFDDVLHGLHANKPRCAS